MNTDQTITIGHTCGYVSILGRPNVGKSTFINSLLGQKVASVSPRPQTTRRRQFGILTLENAQIILVDTPGIHNPRHKLGEFMNATALQTLINVDLILWMVDISYVPQEEDVLVASHISVLRRPPPIFLVLNKTDKLLPEALPERVQAYHSLLPAAIPYLTSQTTKTGMTELLKAILDRLPPGEPLYSPDEITDFYERDIASELIREAALIHLRDEVPHSLAVRIDEYLERGDSGARIGATLLIDREAHKGIVIGKGGEMLKTIGSAARREIEEMSGRKVFLELRVKVNKNWRDNPFALGLLGYRMKKR